MKSKNMIWLSGVLALALVSGQALPKSGNAQSGNGNNPSVVTPPLVNAPPV